jgi:hypothetical protein
MKIVTNSNGQQRVAYRIEGTRGWTVAYVAPAKSTNSYAMWSAWATELVGRGIIPESNASKLICVAIKGEVNASHKCNARCLNALPTSPCSCSCGGHNHAGGR